MYAGESKDWRRFNIYCLQDSRKRIGDFIFRNDFYMQAKARIGDGSVDIFEIDVDIWGLLMDFLWHYSQVQKVSPKSA